MTRIEPDERLKQIAVGVGVLLVICLVVCAGLLGWGYLPGAFGEWVGTMMGVLTTPFFMEASFLVLGLCVVVILNHWRAKREGDDFVFLESVEGPDLPKDLPDHAKWAVFPEKPLDGETPSLLMQAEGAMAIGDHEQAAECLGAMSAEELGTPEVLAVRAALARATGRADLAADLQKEAGEP